MALRSPSPTARSQVAWRGRAGRAVGAAATLALLASALVGCEAQQEPTTPPAADSASSPPTSPTPQRSSAPRSPTASPRADPLEGVPAFPTTRRAGALADQLATVEAVLADRDARVADVRRAGLFEQLAARRLAAAPQEFRRAVLRELKPRVRAKTRRHVEAAALLDAMGSPQRRLPDWRIVEPPPPRQLLGYYRRAARRVGVPWSYLAAIHLVETRMGRIRGVSSAGAQGPMQFLPTTWEIYGEGGDINDPRDAILAAARLLRAHGAPGDMARALWHYNPSDNYVGAVTRYAEQLQRTPRAYRGYWHWRVLYRHVDGTYLLAKGYPEVPARLVADLADRPRRR